MILGCRPTGVFSNAQNISMSLTLDYHRPDPAWPGQRHVTLTDARSARCSWPMAEEIDFAQRYAQGNIPWDSGKPSEELIKVLNAGKLNGKTALEIGCGTGTNAIELARRGFEVTAVDCVEEAIRIARGKAR